MTCYAFDDFIPVVHESAFVHPKAAVTGNVIIGKDVYVGPGAAIRGDWGGIVIEDGCNVQENCTIHMFPGVTVVLEAGAHIGHGAIVHGARIGAGEPAQRFQFGGRAQVAQERSDLARIIECRQGARQGTEVRVGFALGRVVGAAFHRRRMFECTNTLIH